MQRLTVEQALKAYSGFDWEKRAAVEAKCISSPQLVERVMARFLSRGVAQGWFFDEQLEWQSFEGAVPRTVEAMSKQFVELLYEQKDGEAARKLRDRFLDFAKGEEHAPLLEGLYDAGLALAEDGSIVG